jgi:5-(hydroxymethyl)furfural/furfural oxidase
MEHPGVNFGCYLKPAARLPRSLRRQMFAGLRWSSGFEDCPPGDMYLIPSNKAQWHAIGERLGLIMLWVNRSYSTGEVKLTARGNGAPLDIDFNMCSDARDLERLVIGTRLMCRLQADARVQGAVEQVFPISLSDWARRLAVHGPLNAAQTRIGAALMDLSGALRRVLIDELIADAPSLDDLANDDAACREWIRGAVLGHLACLVHLPHGRRERSRRGHRSVRARLWNCGRARRRRLDHAVGALRANTNIPTIMIGEKVAATILAEGAPPSS